MQCHLVGDSVVLRRQSEQLQSPANSMMSNTSHAPLVHNGQLNNQPRRDGRELGHTNHHGNRKHSRNNATLGTGSRRRDDDVITGSGRNFDICSSRHHRRRFDVRYREVIGAILFPLNMILTLLIAYVLQPVTKTFLNSNKWPENVLVKEYYEVIY